MQVFFITALHITLPTLEYRGVGLGDASENQILSRGSNTVFTYGKIMENPWFVGHLSRSRSQFSVPYHTRANAFSILLFQLGNCPQLQFHNIPGPNHFPYIHAIRRISPSSISSPPQCNHDFPETTPNAEIALAARPFQAIIWFQFPYPIPAQSALRFHTIPLQ